MLGTVLFYAGFSSRSPSASVLLSRGQYRDLTLRGSVCLAPGFCAINSALCNGIVYIWNLHKESASLTRLRLHPDTATMPLNNIFRNRQTKTQATLR